MGVNARVLWELYNSTTEDTINMWPTDAEELLSVDSNWSFVREVDLDNPLGKHKFESDDQELGALASLLSAPNKIPYFTNIGQAALADLTAFARTILAASDAASAKSAIGVGYYMSFFKNGVPTANEVLLLHTVAEVGTMADNFLGSAADVATNPTASFTMTVSKNGSAVGTIVISTAGVATFSTTGTTVPLALGDVIKVTAPGVADTTCAGISVTLKSNL